MAKTDGKRQQSASHGTQANPAEKRGLAPTGTQKRGKANSPESASLPSPTGGLALVLYNAELFELWVNGTLVKRLDIRAANQIAILRAFQEENWPPRIDDPLHPNGGDGKARLRSTIHCLNGCQHPPAIHFFADGSGRGIRWALISPPRNPQPKGKRRPPS
jgi:hypothetical protein